MGDPMTADPRRTSGGLGRGLAALIPAAPVSAESTHEVPIARIATSPLQPRGRFDDESLAILTESVLEHGVLQPVLLVEVGDGYRVVAGERRLRAARAAGLATIPAVVRTLDEQQQLALALVENIQRADLNAMDEARAFRRLIDEFGLTQEQVARQVGRSRPAIANTLRLLDVDVAVQRAVEEGRISEGHARALASLPPDAQRQLLGTVMGRGLSVRQVEALAQAWREDPAATPIGSRRVADPDIQRLEARMREALGTKVSLAPGRRGGRITISWFDDEDLARLVERLTGEDRA